MSKQTLPKGFRYLFTKKEIKDIEAISQIPFDEISFGNLVNSERIKTDEIIKSEIKPISISAWQRDSNWVFDIHQSGFRNELLPVEFEKDAKDKLSAIIANYLTKIQNSKETDLLKSPQLWTYIKIMNDKVKVEYRELT